MSEKKKKALEDELLGDLLGDETNAIDKPSEADEISLLHDEPEKDSLGDLKLENDEPDFSAGFGSNDDSRIDLENEPLLSADPASITSPVSSTSHAPSRTSNVGPSPDEATIRIQDSRVEDIGSDQNSAPNMSGTRNVDDEIRASVGRFGAFRNTSSPTGAALAQSENLRIAQNRILELEQEVERLRVENEELAAAGETFRRKSDELAAKAEDMDNRYQNAVTSHSEEKALLIENKETLRRELDHLKGKNEDLELRISTNIQKIRVRERELENRLELVKMEGAALIRSKDEIILDLKRQIDQLGLELNNYRTKSQELNRMILDKQDILRRTVKALRLALTMLEGDEEQTQPLKKAK
jgi:hypothetical protein